MEYQDYYKTLGVDRQATTEEIKKQYRRLARKYHPDVSKEPNAEEMFKKVKEAYEVLKDSEKRKAYDQLGNQWQQGQGFHAPPGWEYATSDRGRHHTAEDINLGEFSDFFEAIFGGSAHHPGAGKQRPFQQKGTDQHSKITITLEEAFHGAQRTLTLREPNLDSKTGQVAYATRQVNVKIPAGVSQGQQIRLAGLGSPGMGNGPHGDLFLEVDIAPHHHYLLEGRDIYLKLPIAPWEAALGAEIEVPTLAGAVKLKIPPGSQTGQKLRLKHRGLPGATAGDQYVLLSIYIPMPTNEEQKNLYQQMKEKMNFELRKDLLR